MPWLLNTLVLCPYCDVFSFGVQLPALHCVKYCHDANVIAIRLGCEAGADR
jgi:hypothetical protein